MTVDGVGTCRGAVTLKEKHIHVMWYRVQAAATSRERTLRAVSICIEAPPST